MSEKKLYTVLFDTNADDPIDLADSWTKLQSDLENRKLYDTRWHPLPACPIEQPVSHLDRSIISTSVTCLFASKKCAAVSHIHPRSSTTVNKIPAAAVISSSLISDPSPLKITPAAAALTSASTHPLTSFFIPPTVSVQSSVSNVFAQASSYAFCTDSIMPADTLRLPTVIANGTSIFIGFPSAPLAHSSAYRAEFETRLTLPPTISFSTSASLPHTDNLSVSSFFASIPSINRCEAVTHVLTNESIPSFSVNDPITAVFFNVPTPALVESYFNINISSLHHLSPSLHISDQPIFSERLETAPKKVLSFHITAGVSADTHPAITPLPVAHTSFTDSLSTETFFDTQPLSSPPVLICDTFTASASFETEFLHALTAIQHTTIDLQNPGNAELGYLSAICEDVIAALQINPSYKNSDFDFNYQVIYTLAESDFPYTIKAKMTTETDKSQTFTAVEGLDPFYTSD